MRWRSLPNRILEGCGACDLLGHRGVGVIVESKSFLTRFFGGALKPMLVTFLKDEKLSQDEIEELKQILEERKE